MSYLTRRTTHHFYNSTGIHTSGRTNFCLTTANGASHRYDNAANSVRLGGYGTLDLRLAWAFSPRWTLEARAGNVFDRRYETIAWYNQPGREYGLSLRYAARD